MKKCAVAAILALPLVDIACFGLTENDAVEHEVLASDVLMHVEEAHSEQAKNSQQEPPSQVEDKQIEYSQPATIEERDYLNITTNVKQSIRVTNEQERAPPASADEGYYAKKKVIAPVSKMPEQE